jgi:hypothetical protein
MPKWVPIAQRPINIFPLMKLPHEILQMVLVFAFKTKKEYYEIARSCKLFRDLLASSGAMRKQFHYSTLGEENAISKFPLSLSNAFWGNMIDYEAAPENIIHEIPKADEVTISARTISKTRLTEVMEKNQQASGFGFRDFHEEVDVSTIPDVKNLSFMFCDALNLQNIGRRKIVELKTCLVPLIDCKWLQDVENVIITYCKHITNLNMLTAKKASLTFEPTTFF